ncbi:RluA family pseudouridine synthase [Alphaproteobacteria bacterium]|nr:RluA family pseudouridine synthase [Alphaproteobacteria bacterium]
MGYVFTINQDDSDVRLDRVIRREFPALKQGQIEKLLRQGKIRVDSEKVKAGFRVHSGQKIEFKFDVSAYNEEKKEHEKTYIALQVTASAKKKAVQQIESWMIDESADWIAINKPAGIAVQGGSGTTHHIDRLLLEGFGDARPRLVHRIDKDTSGILLLAKTQKSARLLTGFFKDQEIKKTYLAFCIGNPGHRGEISEPIAKIMKKGIEKVEVDRQEGVHATTLFDCLFAGDTISMVRLTPLTGRTHQLRVHMAFHQTPLLGDGKYAGAKAHPASEFARMLHLHAHFLRLPDGHLITAKVSEHMQQAATIIGTAIPDTLPYQPHNQPHNQLLA